MTSPVISVVIPTYNRVVTLPRTIGRVLAQTLTDIEAVVVDDGSTDGTSEIVAEMTDPRVRYFRQENRGVSAARNAGARAARGTYLAFLDSDDEVQPLWLERLTGLLDGPQVGVVSCAAEVWLEGASSSGIALPQPFGLSDRKPCGLFLSHTFALRREIFWAVGGYDERLHYSENTELGWRLVEYCAVHGWHFAAVEEPLAVYRPIRMGGARQFGNVPKTLISYETILDKHKTLLARQPRTYASYWSIAGVAAARLGEMDKARAYFRQAVRWDGRNPRHRLRWLLTYVPVVRERFWLRHYG